MPSWNIHTALTEAICARQAPQDLGIENVNAFLLGNVLPDVYVGYLVKDVPHTLRYIDTHFAESTHIPVPHAYEFWDTYVEPYARSGGANELTLGVYTHLLADKIYNERVRAFNAAHAIENNEVTRVKKQHDFDLFGSSLAPSMKLEVDDEVLRQAREFRQYEVSEHDVLATAESLAKQLSANPPKDSSYQLLSDSFIRDAFSRIVEQATQDLASYHARVTCELPPPSIARPAYKLGPEPKILLAEDEQPAAAHKTGE